VRIQRWISSTTVDSSACCFTWTPCSRRGAPPVRGSARCDRESIAHRLCSRVTRLGTISNRDRSPGGIRAATTTTARGCRSVAGAACRTSRAALDLYQRDRTRATEPGVEHTGAARSGAGCPHRGVGGWCQGARFFCSRPEEGTVDCPSQIPSAGGASARLPFVPLPLDRRRARECILTRSGSHLALPESPPESGRPTA
jgi:hypothetical protein